MKEIIIGVTGSIAAYRACDLVSTLSKERNLNVQVIMTQGATRFVTPLTFQTLSGNKVYADVFELPEEWDLVHTSLSAKADLVVVYPATMNVIGKLAHGIADDMLTCTLFATKAPALIVPAMNTRMYENAVTQENITKLKKLGYTFVGPIEGKLACREVGMGHVAEQEKVIAAIQKSLKAKKNKR